MEDTYELFVSILLSEVFTDSNSIYYILIPTYKLGLQNEPGNKFQSLHPLTDAFVVWS